MHFVGHIRVTIADKLLKTVVSISAKDDGHKLGSECDIVVPLNSRIQYLDGTNNYLTAHTKVLFNVGDSILIEAQYEDYDWTTVFNGFIYEFIEGNPMTIKCLDYQYFFNLGIFGSQRLLLKKNKKSKVVTPSVGSSFKQIGFKDLLNKLVDFVNDTIDDKATNTDHVELMLPIFDMTLENLTFAMMSPASILEWFKKELGLNIHLFGNKLYANLASNTTEAIKYRTDRNVLESGLQRAAASFQTFKVKAWFIREDGTKDSFEVGDSSGQLREVFFYKVQRDQSLYQKIANEALNKVKQVQYSGEIETMLYPAPTLFAKASYYDVRYPERNGNYVIVSMDTTIDSGGFRRKLKLAYLSDLNTSV